jgi:hypothetical protein
MKVSQSVEECVGAAQMKHQAENDGQRLRHVPLERETLWHKLDHLLYLPIMGLRRPRGLYYYQGDGLCILYRLSLGRQLGLQLRASLVSGTDPIVHL